MKLSLAKVSLAAESIPLLPIVIAFEFLAPSEPVGSFPFYVLVPAFVAWRVRNGWRIPWREPAVGLGLALILWSTVCLAWGYDPSGVDASKLRWLGDAFCTFVFFLAWLVAAQDRGSGRWLEPALLIGGAGNAVFAIGRHLVFDPAGVRMWGWGITGQPVTGSAIMAVLFVLALDHGLRSRRRTAIGCFVAMPLFGLFMILANSREPVLAAAIAAGYRLGRERWKVIGGFLLASGLALGGVALAAPRRLASMIENDLGRGLDHHVEIWRAAIAAIAHRPFLGYGPTARLPVKFPDLTYPFPHDLYLSTLFYSGVVGLILLVLLMIVLFRRAARIPAVNTAVLLVPLVAGLTDLSQLIKGPSAMWYIFWVPVLLNITEQMKRKHLHPAG